MKRYYMDVVPYDGKSCWAHPVKDSDGEWVRYDDAQATIARLTSERDSQYEMNTRLIAKQAETEAELAEARASTAAAYERAAHLIECDGDALGGKNGAAQAIRTLATEAETTALAEIIGQAAAAETRACPLDEWHEDMGDCVWWCWQDGRWLGEPAMIGNPLDSAWPGYHTHFTPHPAFPARIDQRKEAGERG